jgi:hypothetical protein
VDHAHLSREQQLLAAIEKDLREQDPDRRTSVESGGDMTLSDQDRRVLADIARQVRADDPKLAASLTDRPNRPPAVWAPVGLRALAFVLIAAGTLTSAHLLILVAFAVFGIAHMSGPPTSSQSSTNPD